ncbi:hypothetical protein Salat_0644100 [Sesamum alatum]|uniref:Uncharacterized protein n=1 Tax=Sesamum alatum TaxID=300844 RepID=A0AAE1YRG8_9LAMI|nr:hypothetical protein Salat_0644100 [Sesamum alatum]
MAPRSNQPMNPTVQEIVAGLVERFDLATLGTRMEAIKERFEQKLEQKLLANNASLIAKLCSQISATQQPISPRLAQQTHHTTPTTSPHLFEPETSSNNPIPPTPL